MKLINLLRTILAWPFLAVAWLFYKVYEFVDPYVFWELDYYGNPIIFIDEHDDFCEDCD